MLLFQYPISIAHQIGRSIATVVCRKVWRRISSEDFRLCFTDLITFTMGAMIRFSVDTSLKYSAILLVLSYEEPRREWVSKKKLSILGRNSKSYVFLVIIDFSKKHIKFRNDHSEFLYSRVPEPNSSVRYQTEGVGEAGFFVP